MRFCYLLLFYWSLTAPLAAQPARELRGAWLATVLNIDYPSAPTTDPKALRAEFRRQLQLLRMAGLNTVFVQVRPAGDALYRSRYAPWSQWLTGRQGTAPADDFDPLTYMVEEAHAQGVEFHAWLNPYRVAMSLDTFALHPTHLFYQHRDWVRIYGERMYLDPGLPEVREHLGAVIEELVDNYDIDGVHFDDYFYPYPIAGTDFPDLPTYFRYGFGEYSLPDWRRRNVNIFIAETHRRIQARKPWIHFGVSPFGVWRNRDRDPHFGSATRASVSSYDDLYADALAWARNGTVDYLLPQLYWSIGYAPADYAVLADWWSRNLPPTTQLYVGHAAYKERNNADPAWDQLDELPRQVALNRQLAPVEGSVYFSTKSILQNPFGLASRLAALYPGPVLLPERRAALPRGEAPVEVFRPKKLRSGVRQVVWEVDKEVPDRALPHYFAIYRRPRGGERELIHRTPYGQRCRRLHYLDRRADPKTKYDYEVIALDRFHRPISGPRSRSVLP